jgi:hypothetical protein
VKRYVGLPLVLAAMILLPDVFCSVEAQEAHPRAAAAPQTDLDEFMERVLERRDENWKKLHDYVLDETERFEILGPANARLHGMRRDFTWYVRDGFLIRSPLRFDGVTIPEQDRRSYEDRWMSEEKKREANRQKKVAEGDKSESDKAESRPKDDGAPGFIDERGEPRFVSEAYFLRFRFEPGNYYLVGREHLEGREVLRIEYYPTRMFNDEARRDREEERGRGRRDRDDRRDRESQEELNRKFNKVALVTLWIDPAEHQIVRYTFDNVDFDFLPGRWLVRIDEVSASMQMAQAIDDVWLPREIAMQGSFTLATGTFRVRYDRRFSDHRKAEVSARVRSAGAGER